MVGEIINNKWQYEQLMAIYGQLMTIYEQLMGCLNDWWEVLEYLREVLWEHSAWNFPKSMSGGSGGGSLYLSLKWWMTFFDIRSIHIGDMRLKLAKPFKRHLRNI